MNKNLLLAVLLGIFAVAAFVLSVRAPLPPESIIGYGAVLALLGVAGLEYRVSWKRLFGRN